MPEPRHLSVVPSPPKYRVTARWEDGTGLASVLCGGGLLLDMTRRRATEAADLAEGWSQPEVLPHLLVALAYALLGGRPA